MPLTVDQVPTTNRPLQVYLDSSDFSVLSNPEPYSAYANVKQILLTLASRGEIEIRFSYAHIVEAAPTAQEHLPYALARFRCITALCGQKCLADPAFVMQQKAMVAGHNTNGGTQILRDDGDWCPSYEVDLEVPDLATAWRAELSTFPRKMRRVQTRKFFDSQGRLRATEHTKLRAQAGGILAAEQHQYPMTPQALAAMERFILGVGSKADVNNTLRQSLNDLEIFAEWHAKYWNSISKFSSWLRQSGDNMKASLELASEAAESSYDMHLLMGKTEREAKAAIANSYMAISAGFASRIAEALNPSRVGGSPTADIDWKTAPALMCVSAVAGSAYRLTSLDPTQKRKARTSDFGDLLHCAYIPYVDIFRTDGFMARAISDAGLPLKTHIVANLLELPKLLWRR